MRRNAYETILDEQVSPKLKEYIATFTGDSSSSALTEEIFQKVRPKFQEVLRYTLHEDTDKKNLSEYIIELNEIHEDAARILFDSIFKSTFPSIDFDTFYADYLNFVKSLFTPLAIESDDESEVDNRNSVDLDIYLAQNIRRFVLNLSILGRREFNRGRLDYDYWTGRHVPYTCEDLTQLNRVLASVSPEKFNMICLIGAHNGSLLYNCQAVVNSEFDKIRVTLSEVYQRSLRHADTKLAEETCSMISFLDRRKEVLNRLVETATISNRSSALFGRCDDFRREIHLLIRKIQNCESASQLDRHIQAFGKDHPQIVLDLNTSMAEEGRSLSR